MADLNDDQKREIVEALACFGSPAAIVARFQSEYGVELSLKQVGRYDPTRAYYAAGENWREVFEARRRAYLEDGAAVPVANQGYRLNILQLGVDAAVKARNWVLAASLLEQAAKEVGGRLTNQRELKLDEPRRPRARDATPEDRRARLEEIIGDALERLAHKRSLANRAECRQ